MNGENNKYRTDRYEEQKINGDILIRITVMIDLTKKKLVIDTNDDDELFFCCSFIYC